MRVLICGKKFSVRCGGARQTHERESLTESVVRPSGESFLGCGRFSLVSGSLVVYRAKILRPDWLEPRVTTKRHVHPQGLIFF